MSKIRLQFKHLFAYLAIFVFLGNDRLLAQAQLNSVAMDLRTEAARQKTVQLLTEQSVQSKKAAEAMALQRGWKIRGELPGGRVFDLMEVVDGLPHYNSTCNANAAISTSADRLRNTAPYNVNGFGYTVGIWDSGAVRSTHQEFGSRVLIKDGASVADHATHVGGTIGASGVVPVAMGMASSVKIDSYEWTSDEAEMAGRAATAPGQVGRIYVSNHSYGTIMGWDTGSWSGSTGPHWFGTFGERESRSFGQYNSKAVSWDSLHYNAPYYLAFKAAGNDRNDTAPAVGTLYYYYNTTWLSKTYNPATDPYADGWDTGGYDTMDQRACAKNIMTVGAVNDAVSGGSRVTTNGTMSTFSSWGPTDDGRVKPDIVANGVNLYSSVGTSDTSYSGTYSGTSMATPNAAGSAILLVEYYGKLFPGQSMRASTLKGLIIHTADDLGTAGPDYKYGWGLMNAEAAAKQIDAHAQAPSCQFLYEGILTAGNPSYSVEFLSDGISQIRATMCWTDPAGIAKTGLDDRGAVLVNDLDLRVTGPGGVQVVYPYILNVNSPASAAATGDNGVDNVEQIRIAAPVAGSYTLTVGHKGTLSGGQQCYSLILSGQSRDALEITPTSGFVSTGMEGGPFSPSDKVCTLTNMGGSNLTWAAECATNWVIVAPPVGTLAAGASTNVSVSIHANANNLSAGTYNATVDFSNVNSGSVQTREVSLNVWSTNLTLTLPVSGYEGQVFTNGGRVEISGSLASNLTVSLSSSDLSEVALTNQVIIQAGQTSVTFNVTLPPDGLTDGTQTETVTASASGFASAVSPVEVRDRDLHHFSLSSMDSPQAAGSPFSVTLSAQDINGVTITVYQGSVLLSSAGDHGSVVTTPTNALLAGGLWIGAVRVNSLDSGVRLTADDGEGHVVQSNPFDVQVGPVDHFVWAPVGSPQCVDVPFPVTVTAQDAGGNTVTGFVGTAALSGSRGAGGTSSRLVITECSSSSPDYIEIQNVLGQTITCSGWVVVLSASYTDINAVNTVLWTLDSAMSPGQVLYRTDSTNDNYWGSNIYWNPSNNGWAMIMDGSGQVVDFVAWGWTQPQFAAMTPVVNGHTITLSDQFTTDGVSASGSGSIQRQGDQDNNTASDFLWSSSLSKGTQNVGLSVPFVGGESLMSIVPAIASGFIDGVWNGAVTVSEPTSSMLLRAADGSGHSGASGVFTVEAFADLGISMTDSPDPATVGSNLTYSISVFNAGPSRANGVRVIDNLPATVSLVSASPSQGTITNVGGTVTWDVGVLSNGVGAAATIVVMPTLGGVLTNSAVLTADVTDPNPNNNSASKVWTVTGRGVLAVTPGRGLSALGFAGGPFTPESQSYTLTNSGTDTIAWQALSPAGWIGLSAAGGTLPARSAATVTVSIGAGAGQLPGGTYADTVNFTNLSTADGSTDRAVSLTVLRGGLLGTVWASDNGYAGSMFDIVPKKNLGINAVDVNVSPSGQVATVTVYYREGGSFGHEGESAGWSLLGTQTVTSAGLDLPTFVDLGGNGVEFLKGVTYGLYVSVDYDTGATLRYTKGSGVYETPALTLISNCGKGDPPFAGGTYASRIWNGALYYDTELVDALGVSPAAETLAQGAQGGPFAMSGEAYTVANRGDEEILTWTAGCASNWVSVVPNGGLLLAGASNRVTVAVNSNAEALAVGDYRATVAFSNAASGAVLTRGVVLNVWSTELTVTVPASAQEGQVATNGGRVAIGYALASNLTVRLSASDTNEIRVPPQVTLAAGQTQAVFDVEALADGRVDGAKRVTVTATAAGFVPGAAVITVENVDIASNEVVGVGFDLATDPGWICEGQWQFGKPTGQGGAAFGNPDPAGGYTGTNVFGVNLQGDYAVAVGGPYSLTCGPLDFTGYTNVTVRFRRWLNSDSEPYVRVAVELSTNGTAWSAVWTNGLAGCYESAWRLVEYPLPAADRAPRVFVRWSYRVGPEAFAASGWNLDDIVFSGVPEPALTTARGTPRAWLQRYGLGALPGWEVADIADADGDGKAAWEEYVADTDPTNRASVLAVMGVTVGAGGVGIHWKGGVAATQYVERKGNLTQLNAPWTVFFTNHPPTGFTNGVLDAVGTNRTQFYRVRAVR